MPETQVFFLKVNVGTSVSRVPARKEGRGGNGSKYYEILGKSS